MDGRVQEPVSEWVKNHSGVIYADMITEAGMDGLLQDKNGFDKVSSFLQISFEKHGSQRLYIVGHSDCLGFPVEDAIHQSAVRQAVQHAVQRYPQISVFGLWVDETGLVNLLT